VLLTQGEGAFPVISKALQYGGNLTIPHLTKDDQGSYECVASNPVTNVITSSLLIIECIIYLIIVVVIIKYLVSHLTLTYRPNSTFQIRLCILYISRLPKHFLPDCIITKSARRLCVNRERYTLRKSLAGSQNPRWKRVVIRRSPTPQSAI